MCVKCVCVYRLLFWVIKISVNQLLRNVHASTDGMESTVHNSFQDVQIIVILASFKHVHPRHHLKASEPIVV